MAWEVIVTEEFGEWFSSLDENQQRDIQFVIGLLRERGPQLGRPYADTLAHTTLRNLKELRAQTIRVLFAFDPRRQAVLLLGGDKASQWDRWYRKAIPQAERLYAEHLQELEGKGNGN